MEEYSINSNDGWQTIKFIKEKEINDDFFIFQFVIGMNYWKKDDILHDKFDELVEDKRFIYKQLYVSKQKWDYLLEIVKEWKEDKMPIAIDLYNEHKENVTFTIEKTSNDMIVPPGKFILSIMINDSRSKFQFDMIVDRTSFNHDSSEL